MADYAPVQMWARPDIRILVVAVDELKTGD